MTTRDYAGDRGAIEDLQQAFGEEFEVSRVLGRGSMAIVYLARERALRRMVAIKVLKPDAARDETSRRRFEREARAAASLSHPKVVRVHRFGRLPDQTPYLVMEFVRGRTMEERLKAEGELPVEVATQVLLDIASALAAAHARGIVHRDVRPANILWSEDRDEALLTDFGIAGLLDLSGEEISRLTDAGQLIGDPRYLSPEQLYDEDLTELSDVYSFGILGYELLCGEGPYEATTSSKWLEAHKSQEPRNLLDLRDGIDTNVADLLRRCLSKEPKHRPSAADIVRGLSGEWQLNRPPGPLLRGALAGTLLRRRVPQTMLGAGVVSWGIVEAVDTLIENARLPEPSFDLALVFAVAAVVSTGVVAWFHGGGGAYKPPAAEYLLLGAIVLAAVLASVLLT